VAADNQLECGNWSLSYEHIELNTQRECSGIKIQGAISVDCYIVSCSLPVFNVSWLTHFAG